MMQLARWRCVLWSLLALTLPSVMAGDAPAAAPTKTAQSGPYSVTCPEKVAVGDNFEIKVVYKGLKVTKGVSKLRCDLHWIRSDGVKQYFFAMVSGSPTVDTDGEVSFKTSVAAREGLGSVYPVFFVTDDGNWANSTHRGDGPAIVVEGAPPVKSELLFSEDFEKLADLKSFPAGWSLVGKEFALATDPVQGKVLNIKRAAGEDLTALDITLDAKKAAGQRVRLSALVKFPGKYEAVAGKDWARPRLSLRAFKGDAQAGSRDTNIDPEKADWQTVEVGNTLDKDVDKVLLSIRIQLVAAEIWVDNIKVEINPDAKAQAANPAGNQPKTPAVDLKAVPAKTIDDGGIMFNADIVKVLKTACAKANSTKNTVAFIGPGLPNKEYALRPPSEWTQVLTAKELTGAAATPRALLVSLPDLLVKEKPEMVVFFGETAPARKVVMEEQYDWQDIARLCLRLGTIPVLALPPPPGEKEENKDVRRVMQQAAEDVKCPAVCVKAPSTAPKRIAELGILVEKYIFGRIPLDAPTKPTDPNKVIEE